MQNKMMYVYQMSLANGKVLIHESEGLYSTNKEDEMDYELDQDGNQLLDEQGNPTPKRILINSATLIATYEVDADGKPIKNQPEEVVGQLVEVE